MLFRSDGVRCRASAAGGRDGRGGQTRTLGDGGRWVGRTARREEGSRHRACDANLICRKERRVSHSTYIQFGMGGRIYVVSRRQTGGKTERKQVYSREARVVATREAWRESRRIQRVVVCVKEREGYAGGPYGNSVRHRGEKVSVRGKQRPWSVRGASGAGRCVPAVSACATGGMVRVVAPVAPQRGAGGLLGPAREPGAQTHKQGGTYVWVWRRSAAQLETRAGGVGRKRA